MKNKLHAKVHPSSFIGPTVKINDEAIVGPNCYIDGEISIGKGAKLLGGITLIGTLYIGDDCVLEPSVCIANEGGEIRSGFESGVTTVGSGAYIGAGSVIAAGISIGINAKVSAGTIVSRNIPAHAIVQGNPAIIVGYKGEHSGEAIDEPFKTAIKFEDPGIYKCSVNGVTIHRFERIRDLRGDLTVGEFPKSIPFNPKRFFLVYDVPSAETRGEHAHRECQQFLVCAAGSLGVVVDDGVHREEILLNHPNIGLYIPAGIWGIQYKYSVDGVLLVFASDYYDPQDYIRDYEDFVKGKGLTS